MLSSATLNRVSSAYRRGYYAGHALEPAVVEGSRGTFAHHDYTTGYKAGLNDRYWSDFHAKAVTMSRDEFMKMYA